LEKQAMNYGQCVMERGWQAGRHDILQMDLKDRLGFDEL
jgi:hypothetical protein